MKKLTLFIILTFFICVLATSQSCLPNGIFLTTQSQIDNFQTDYPNPAQSEISISCQNFTTINEVNIYIHIGQKILTENSIDNAISVSSLKQGLYIVELVSDNSKIRDKLIISP